MECRSTQWKSLGEIWPASFHSTQDVVMCPVTRPGKASLPPAPSVWEFCSAVAPATVEVSQGQGCGESDSHTAWSSPLGRLESGDHCDFPDSTPTTCMQYTCWNIGWKRKPKIDTRGCSVFRKKETSTTWAVSVVLVPRLLWKLRNLLRIRQRRNNHYDKND